MIPNKIQCNIICRSRHKKQDKFTVLLNLDLSVSFFMHLFQDSYYLESNFETDPHLEAIGIAVDVNFKWI